MLFQVKNEFNVQTKRQNIKYRIVILLLYYLSIEIIEDFPQPIHSPEHRKSAQYLVK